MPQTGTGGPGDKPDSELDIVHEIDEIREHDSLTRSEVANVIDKVILTIGSILSWGAVILVFVIILQVVLRYGFRSGLIVLEELQWHLYAVGVMFGLSYAQVKDSHIRVDIMHMKFSDTTKRIIEILGILILLLPFCWVLFYHSLDFVADSWRVNERSDAPLGLCCRWAIKTVIPLSIGLLALAAISRIMHDVVALTRGRQSDGN